MLTLLALCLPASAQEVIAESSEGCRIVLDGTDVFFEGCNVHIRNDLGSTSTKNSLGNLILGYNENRTEEAVRTGSHNLVVGEDHGYNGYASVVTGRGNQVQNRSAVLAAENSSATAFGSVLGGQDNHAFFGTVVGGLENHATQQQSVVVGGFQNFALGEQSTVCGGAGGKASGGYALAAGGNSNQADGDFSTVVGGSHNIGNGVASTIFGGDDNWVGGNGQIVGGDSCSTVADLLLGASCTSTP